MISKNFWGQSLHIDLNGCDSNKLDKNNLINFCNLLCNSIGMKKYKEAKVQRFGKGKLKGNSLLQFIQTSSISIHADEYFNRVFIDIFSCKSFDKKKARSVSKKFFSADNIRSKSLIRC